MPINRTYRGFSTKHYEARGGNFSLYNVDLIEEDILNELYTIKGERLNMPDFGTRIPLLVYEPNDTETAEILKEDIETVLTNEPRVKILDLEILSQPDAMSLIALVKVQYIEFDVVRDIRIEINS